MGKIQGFAGFFFVFEIEFSSFQFSGQVCCESQVVDAVSKVVGVKIVLWCCFVASESMDFEDSKKSWRNPTIRCW